MKKNEKQQIRSEATELCELFLIFVAGFGIWELPSPAATAGGAVVELCDLARIVSASSMS